MTHQWRWWRRHRRFPSILWPDSGRLLIKRDLRTVLALDTDLRKTHSRATALPYPIRRVVLFTSLLACFIQDLRETAHILGFEHEAFVELLY